MKHHLSNSKPHNDKKKHDEGGYNNEGWRVSRKPVSRNRTIFNELNYSSNVPSSIKNHLHCNLFDSASMKQSMSEEATKRSQKEQFQPKMKITKINRNKLRAFWVERKPVGKTKPGFKELKYSTDLPSRVNSHLHNNSVLCQQEKLNIYRDRKSTFLTHNIVKKNWNARNEGDYGFEKACQRNRLKRIKITLDIPSGK